MGKLAIVGTGFVADLYMRSLKTFPDLKVIAAFDTDRFRLEGFCGYWSVPAAASLDDLLQDHPEAIDLVLNLTNPGSHFAVSKQCLEAGRSVYSEKPLATDMTQAFELHALATS